MSETLLDPRISDWLGQAPTGSPAGSFETIMERVAGTPHRGPALRIAGRPLFARHLAVAAALVLAVTGSGLVMRDRIGDLVTASRTPDHLLYAFPETRTILEGRGGPADAPATTVLGRLPGGGAFVIAARCAGEGDLRVEVTSRPAGSPDGPDTAVYRTLEVRCDDSIASLRYPYLDHGTGDIVEVRVVADAEVAWAAAVGEAGASLAEPRFPAIDPGAGRLMLTDGLTELVGGPVEVSAGLGVDMDGLDRLIILVQCLGDPVTIWMYGGPEDPTGLVGQPVGRVECQDGATTTEVAVEITDGSGVRAASDGFTWVHLAAAGDGTPAVTRPEAPPLPAGIAEVWFAEGDGENVAFGRLGDNTQAIVRIDRAMVGTSAGEYVAIAAPDGAGGSVLDLWSIPEAAPVARLADIDGAEIFGSWVDATNRQVFYGVSQVLGIAEYHRVAFDGTGDVTFASTPVGIEEAQAGLAIDDAHFMAQWCPLVGACERVVYTTGTGAVETVSRDGDRMCALSGIAEATLVGLTPECDTAGGITAQGLFGGERLTISELRTSATVIPTTDGPRVVVLDVGETVTKVLVARLDGSDLREVVQVEHESGANPYLSDLRLPVGDWVLLAGALSDAPTRAVVTHTPILVNIVTGERILLVNLPGDDR